MSESTTSKPPPIYIEIAFDVRLRSRPSELRNVFSIGGMALLEAVSTIGGPAELDDLVADQRWRGHIHSGPRFKRSHRKLTPRSWSKALEDIENREGFSISLEDTESNMDLRLRSDWGSDISYPGITAPDMLHFAVDSQVGVPWIENKGPARLLELFTTAAGDLSALYGFVGAMFGPEYERDHTIGRFTLDLSQVIPSYGWGHGVHRVCPATQGPLLGRQQQVELSDFRTQRQVRQSVASRPVDPSDNHPHIESPCVSNASAFLVLSDCRSMTVGHGRRR